MTAAPLQEATLAADTWGVPGPLFLGGYAVLALVTAYAVVTAPDRDERRRTGDAATPAVRLSPAEVAFLKDGDRRALAATVAALRAGDALDDAARPTGRGGPTDRLGTEVLAALPPGEGRPTARKLSTLLVRPGVHHALRQLEAGLGERGLLRTPAEHRRARVWSLALWAVVALGVARCVAGALHDKPIGWIALATGLTAAVALGVAIAGAVLPNRAAQAALRDAERENAHLRPHLRPSWPTYGPDAVGMSVALFGVTALTALAPTFAQAVDARELFDLNTGETSSSGGGGGCGG